MRLRIFTNKALVIRLEDHVFFVAAGHLSAKRALRLIADHRGRKERSGVAELNRRIKDLGAFQAANLTFGHWTPLSWTKLYAVEVCA